MLDIANRVLVFTSQPIVGDLIAYRLKLLGMELVWVKSESAMQASLSERLPHLLMVDLDMLECDAMRTIEGLASDEITSRIPILCLSAEGDLDKAEKAFHAGARDFLVVPFDPIVLEDKVAQLLKRCEERNEQAVVNKLATTV